VKIPCSKKVFKLWEKFITNPKNVAVCQSSAPGDILEAMMEECASWEARAEELADAGEKLQEAS